MKEKKQDVIVIVNVRKLVLFLVTVTLCLMAAVTCFHVAKRFVRVRRFEVSGAEHYDPEDIINASGVKLGDLLYGKNAKEIEEVLLEACPFLEEAEADMKFPNRLCFNVVERRVPWYLEVSGAKYALDMDLLVIDELSDTKDMTKLVLPNVRRVVSGAVPEFAESETELRKTLEVINAIRSTSFLNRMTEIDLTSRWDIKLVIDGKFTVIMGDMSNFSAKLDAVRSVLNSDRLEGAESGTLWAADPKNGVAVSVQMPQGPVDKK